MKHLHISKMKRFIGLLFIILAMTVTTTFAMYQINRPLDVGEEPINQTYLYGVGDAVHKGVDWSYAEFGDPVFSVASGKVIRAQWDWPDDCHPTPPPPDNPNYCPTYWGNFVLIQHDVRHYDRNSHQNGYT